MKKQLQVVGMPTGIIEGGEDTWYLFSNSKRILRGNGSLEQSVHGVKVFSSDSKVVAFNPGLGDPFFVFVLKSNVSLKCVHELLW